MQTLDTEVLVIGAGSIGISVAYYLKHLRPNHRVTLIDCMQPMAFTSAQSGENYRNWWPHPVMRDFTDHSIDLMEQIARDTKNQIQMTRGGYLLATRSSDIEPYLADLSAGYKGSRQEVRIHNMPTSVTYQPAEAIGWESAPDGVDILSNNFIIKRHYPYFDPKLNAVFHVRKAGTISSQQLGQYMLAAFKASGGARLIGKIKAIEKSNRFQVTLDDGRHIFAEQIVNAAGPFVGEIAGMLGVELPVENWVQQKIAFEDSLGVISRTMPFAIDLDGQRLDWDDEERSLLKGDPEFSWLASDLPGGVHCRPDGGLKGKWLKLGWAYNQLDSLPSFEAQLDDQFPEIVLRGAARLNPALKAYYGKLPRAMVHYGGYYTLTKENWPLLGPTKVGGFYVAGALSGFGTMAACASGELVAQWVLGEELPHYAGPLSPRRYENDLYAGMIQQQKNRGIL